MNSAELILAAIVFIPALILFWFRINASIVFLSLCLGNVLMQFVSPDAHQFLALFSAHVTKGIDAGNSTIKLILILFPPILSSVMMVKSVKGNHKYLNILPALGVGLLAALLVTPLLSAHLSNSIINSNDWTQLKSNEAAVVGISSIIALLVLWLQGPKNKHEKGKHSK